MEFALLILDRGPSGISCPWPIPRGPEIWPARTPALSQPATDIGASSSHRRIIITTVNEYAVYQRMVVDVDQWPTVGQILPVVYSPRTTDCFIFQRRLLSQPGYPAAGGVARRLQPDRVGTPRLALLLAPRYTWHPGARATSVPGVCQAGGRQCQDRASRARPSLVGPIAAQSSLPGRHFLPPCCRTPAPDADTPPPGLVAETNSSDPKVARCHPSPDCSKRPRLLSAPISLATRTDISASHLPWHIQRIWS